MATSVARYNLLCRVVCGMNTSSTRLPAPGGSYPCTYQSSAHAPEYRPI